MISASGRYVIVYNGEIYNHQDLRVGLEKQGLAPEWRGYSDTEVLLAAFDAWGVVAALAQLNGMFAIALWDRQLRELYLMRDRMGEKPLYYGLNGQTLMFASELKAFKAHPSFRPNLDFQALALMLRHNYVPGPWSIWQGIKKLLPAHYVKIKLQPQGIDNPVAYWDFSQIAQNGIAFPITDERNALDELEKLLRDAVGRRMVSDVPLGAFLSGGVDSSTIVALMQVQSAQSVKTFSIGFKEKEFDESAHARAVAKHLRTDHTELFVTPKDALAVIPDLPKLWDEPFSDSSQIPTYLLSALTRKYVTVCLSGDGGDELFGGYNRYFMATKIWRAISKIPAPFKPVTSNLLRSSWSAWGANLMIGFLPDRYAHKNIGDRLQKVAQILEVTSPEELYHRLISHWEKPECLLPGTKEPKTILTNPAVKFEDPRQTMMYLDTLTYLPDDILTKVDRASMAVSLEARVPLLDHRVVEFAWRLPVDTKIKGNTGKNILRKILYRHVPRELIDRPKMGFGVPIDTWLRGPLKDWAEDLLSEERLKTEGIFNPAPIRRLWTEHKEGTRRWHYYLWDVLMFQAWWAENNR